MNNQADRYINPYTDFGFKKLFGTELNKELLISFLNALFDGKQTVRDVHYLNGEQLGGNASDRRSVFDVYCISERGERFIVEMQKVEQAYFKDRTVYYATFPIQEQAKKGNWDYRLENVYTIGILNFVFPEDEYSEECFHHEVKLMDTADKHVFYDKLTFIYLEMPKFNKTEDQLVTMLDKWMFVLRNLSRLMERPAALQERIFTRLFEQAEIAKFSQSEMKDYQESLKVFRDMNSAIKTAEKKGEARGLEQGMEIGHKNALLEMAKKMKEKGNTPDDIAELTGLSEEEIGKL